MPPNASKPTIIEVGKIPPGSNSTVRLIYIVANINSIPLRPHRTKSRRIRNHVEYRNPNNVSSPLIAPALSDFGQLRVGHCFTLPTRVEVDVIGRG